MSAGRAFPDEGGTTEVAPLAVAAAADAGGRAWARLALTVFGRAFQGFFGTLLVVALLPMVWGWPSYLVSTGSMEPTVAVGDVVIASPFSDSDPVPVGRVMVFDNPAISGGDKLLVHRVVEYLGHDEYVTAGDANRQVDATPVPADSFRARARVLVPFVGLPLVWLRQGELLPLGVWLLLSVAALVLAPRRLPAGGTAVPEGPEGPEAPEPPPRAGPWALAPQRPAVPQHRARKATSAAVVISLAAGALVTALGLTIVPADSGFTATTRNSSSSWTVGQLVERYNTEVLADDPYVFHLVDEHTGPTAADYSGNDIDGTFSSIGSFRQPDALPNNSGYSVNLGGGTGRLVTGGSSLASPTTFTLELWFRTSTNAGGKLIGFESSRNSTGTSFDRHVFMNNSGRIVYGGWTTTTLRTITSPKAYNNGEWHHLVVTAVPRGQQQDAIMYIDGAEVVRGTTSRTGVYNGWWRVGYGNLASGGIYPSSRGFSGSIDQPAVYTRALSASRVSAHYAAR